MGYKIITKKQLSKLKGLFLDVYPLHYHQQDKQGNWETVFELRGKSKTIKENFQSVEEILTEI